MSLEQIKFLVRKFFFPDMLTRLIMVDMPSYCMFSGKVHEHIVFKLDFHDRLVLCWLYGTVLCYLGFDSILLDFDIC